MKTKLWIEHVGGKVSIEYYGLNTYIENAN